MATINKSDILSWWDKVSTLASVPPLPVKTNFFRLLAIGQKVWLGLRESLSSIAMSEHNPAMKWIINDLIVWVSQWETLSNAMSKHLYFFDTTEIELIKSAQIMGNLPETLEGIAQELENFASIKKKIKGALTYPITLLVFSVVVVAILLIKVIPTIITLFPSKESLPGVTIFVLDVSDFMIERWWTLLLLIIWFFTAYNLLYKYFFPFKMLIDSTILKVPTLWEAIKTFYMYRFSKLLWDFMLTWVDQISAIKQIGEIFENFMYKQKAADIQTDLNSGFNFTDTIEWSNLFDPILIQIIAVGEETGNLWEILQKMSGFYKEQLMTKISNVMALIEPLLLAMMAGMIGTIVASIFLPMTSMLSNI